ncbi:MAG: D-glucuronyl C5-epimerase family protein [Thermodesulfobacteriota bacterium]|nr:D-glucuronyl C5-epimerase family protein [Thermodesulfobacteriota bacterium]
MGRLSYYQRIFKAYLTQESSQLTFWHGEPLVNEGSSAEGIGEYYMPFIQKANYPGHYDDAGIPLLDYHGRVGLRYNPIAIAQYGLGNYNLYRRTRKENRKSKFLCAADWLAQNLEKTAHGTRVWHHHFDWEYRDKLKAPWYSALAQGQGLSLLIRAHQETRKDSYLQAAHEALHTFKKDVKEGGVSYIDRKGHVWFEEAIVNPPTHILNGFIWAMWGIYDYFLYTADGEARMLFREGVETLKANLSHFDAGFWSLYEQSGTRMKMLASPFYHKLHIVQLKVMHKLTHDEVFQYFAIRWEGYRRSWIKRMAAICHKACFKLVYY